MNSPRVASQEAPSSHNLSPLQNLDLSSSYPLFDANSFGKTFNVGTLIIIIPLDQMISDEVMVLRSKIMEVGGDSKEI